MIRRIAVAASLVLAATAVLPGPAQARQGEEELQAVGGSVMFLTRFTDGEGGFPGVPRRLYQHAHELNGIFGYVFAVDPETWNGRFDLTVTGQQNPPGDADLGLYLYKDLADGGNAVAVSTANYDVRAPGGETGFIPPETYYGIVFMSRGLNVTFNYKGFSPMSVEVSEDGFAPAEVTIGSGGYVVWDNVGDEFHSVSGSTFDSSPSPKQPLIPGARFVAQFLEVGDFAYVDRYGEATGTVHVVPGPGPGTPAA